MPRNTASMSQLKLISRSLNQNRLAFKSTTTTEKVSEGTVKFKTKKTVNFEFEKILKFKKTVKFVLKT